MSESNTKMNLVASQPVLAPIQGTEATSQLMCLQEVPYPTRLGQRIFTMKWNWLLL